MSEKEKHQIIEDFKKRPKNVDINSIHSYEEWLRVQYGNYFAEHFPMVYTRKYWMCEANNLETGWVGNRLYQPSLEEVIQGSLTQETPVTYYAKEMRYPAEGGFKTFLNVLVDEANIKFNSEVVEINTEKRMLRTVSGDLYQYDRLISSLPLPEVLNMLQELPEEVRSAGNQLKCTCGYQISVGLKTKNIPPYLWWYIYDEDILPARVYSPSLKSPDNAPGGCSSLQMEVYCNRNEYMQEEHILKEEDILFTDIRFEPYANVIFDHNIYEARKTVRDYLSFLGIETIGRFGEWEYLWSDQSLLSGLDLMT